MVFRRLYRMARHDANEMMMGRRDFMKIAAGGVAVEEAGRELADDGGDELTVFDALSPHQLEEVAGKINVDVSYGEENAENHATAEGHSTPVESSSGDSGSASSDRIKNYNEFESGLRNQSSQSLDYLEGALEADPGRVGEVSFESDGLYVDSTVAEWSRMDGSMRNYLENAEQSGDLDEWLSRYEQENL